MRTVYKYTFSIHKTFKLQLHQDFRILKVEEQRGEPCMWVEVDTNNNLKDCYFHVIGTGHELPKHKIVHIGSAQSTDQFFVWHLYMSLDELSDEYLDIKTWSLL